jgi:serine phosphatase RsbU (regulator of sigma subunit)/anti-sigma regulatory factor (Ser/Thr protein kinase)
LEISPEDPVLAYFQSSNGAVDISKLELDSPAVTQMREAGIVLAVPLISSGELIGLLNVGPRLSEGGYSSDDRQLLESLAGYAAPAMRVGQLVDQQASEARIRERIDQELKVAQLIQQQFLPRSLPDLPSWHVAAFYRPARTVGGDFYDFIPLADGRIMLVVGDVTDKGVPAALVMASTHSLLRFAAPRLTSPGKVLAQVNDLLCEDIPEHMFVTCLVLVLDPSTGQVEYANAGHDLPYVRTADGVVELRATGMPLGLMPGTSYEEKQFQFRPGDCLLLHSDGLAEAHDPAREMFGFPRVAELVGRAESGEALIDLCLTELGRFTGPNHEQEDDITLVTLQRTGSVFASNGSGFAAHEDHPERVIAEFEVASREGNEREALARVAAAVSDAGLTSDQLERLKTAVAETTMNAIEHGNLGRETVPVRISVSLVEGQVVVDIADEGGEAARSVTPDPDIDLKLEGLQTPRGWGLFLIRNMVDEMQEFTDGGRHTVRLKVRPMTGSDAPSIEP